MNFLDLLKSAMTSACKSDDKLVYSYRQDQDDTIIFCWYVIDAHMGYTVFSYDKPEDKNTEPVFQKWFATKSEAIEYAVDQGRAQKASMGL